MSPGQIEQLRRIEQLLKEQTKELKAAPDKLDGYTIHEWQKRALKAEAAVNMKRLKPDKLDGYTIDEWRARFFNVETALTSERYQASILEKEAARLEQDLVRIRDEKLKLEGQLLNHKPVPELLDGYTIHEWKSFFREASDERLELSAKVDRLDKELARIPDKLDGYTIYELREENERLKQQLLNSREKCSREKCSRAEGESNYVRGALETEAQENKRFAEIIEIQKKEIREWRQRAETLREAIDKVGQVVLTPRGKQ